MRGIVQFDRKSAERLVDFSAHLRPTDPLKLRLYSPVELRVIDLLGDLHGGAGQFFEDFGVEEILADQGSNIQGGHKKRE